MASMLSVLGYLILIVLVSSSAGVSLALGLYYRHDVTERNSILFGLSLFLGVLIISTYIIIYLITYPTEFEQDLGSESFGNKVRRPFRTLSERLNKLKRSINDSIYAESIIKKDLEKDELLKLEESINRVKLERDIARLSNDGDY